MRDALLAITLLLLSVPAAADAQRVRLEGPMVPGAVLIGTTDPGTEILVDGEPVMVGSDGRFVIGLPRDASGSFDIRARFANGLSFSSEYAIEERSYLESIVQGVPGNTLAPDQDEQRRIWAEQAIIDAARERRDDRSDFADGFILPAEGRISGTYGTARRYNDESRLRIHWGLDVAQPTGTPVVAPAAGVVTLAEDDLFYSGGTVFLDHGHGMISSFLHLSRLDVAVGDVLEQGDAIGAIGSTGRSTGPHLDWRIRLRGIWVDPATLLPPGTLPADEG